MSPERRRPVKIDEEPIKDGGIGDQFDKIMEALIEEVPSLADPNAEVIDEASRSEYHKVEEVKDEFQ